jgi:hypothetical protein
VVATAAMQSVQQLLDKEILELVEIQVPEMSGLLAVAVEQVHQEVRVLHPLVEMVVQEQHGLRDLQLQLQLH